MFKIIKYLPVFLIVLALLTPGIKGLLYSGNFDPIAYNGDYTMYVLGAQSLITSGDGVSFTGQIMGYLYAQPLPSLLIFMFTNIFNNFLAFYAMVILFTLLAYYWIRRLGFDPYISLIPLLFNNGIILSLFHVTQIDALLITHRIANPLLSLWIFYMFAYYLFKEEKIWPIILSFTLLVFSYVYFWTSALVMIVVFGLYKKDYRRTLRILILCLLPLIVYLVNVLHVSNSINMLFWQSLNNVVHTHGLIVQPYAYVWLISTFIWVLTLFQRRNFKLDILIFSGIAGTFNHVITGVALQPGHWHAFIVFPLLLAKIFILLRDRNIKLYRFGYAVCILLMFLFLHKLPVDTEKIDTINWAYQNLNGIDTILTSEDMSYPALLSGVDTIFTLPVRYMPEDEWDSRKIIYADYLGGISMCNIYTPYVYSDFTLPCGIHSDKIYVC